MDLVKDCFENFQAEQQNMQAIFPFFDDGIWKIGGGGVMWEHLGMFVLSFVGTCNCTPYYLLHSLEYSIGMP